MRSIGWFLGVVVGLGWAGSAAALEMGFNGCGSCAGGMPCEGTGFGAPPCAAPFFGGTPGCCRMAPTPCDNAWDGYCEERAFWRAIWHQAGTRPAGFSGWRQCQEVAGPFCPPGGCTQPGSAQPPSAASQTQPPLEPVPRAGASPGLPPAPEPEAVRTSWRWRLPWVR